MDNSALRIEKIALDARALCWCFWVLVCITEDERILSSQC